MGGPGERAALSTRAVPSDPRPLVTMAIRLARGRADSPVSESLNWRSLFELAAAERLAPLAWWRSADVIRSKAPSDVVNDWRRHAHGARLIAHVQLESLGELVEKCGAGGVTPIVLKGLPLERRIYGELGVRPSTDLDVFIPLGDRTVVAAILRENGWQHFEGTLPADETWIRRTGVCDVFLDLHSQWTSQWLNHLGISVPPMEIMEIEGVPVPAESGPLLPALVAAHVAKHQFAPLLWFEDVGTWWARLDEPARTASREAARLVGLDRYLDWGLSRHALLDRAASADPQALAELGFDASGRTDTSPRLRDFRLARGTRAHVAVILNWIAPPDARGDVRTLAGRWAGRLTRLGRHFRQRRGIAPPGPAGRSA